MEGNIHIYIVCVLIRNEKLKELAVNKAAI